MLDDTFEDIFGDNPNNNETTNYNNLGGNKSNCIADDVDTLLSTNFDDIFLLFNLSPI